MTPHYCAQVELKPVWPTQPDLGVLARNMQFTAKAAVWRESTWILQGNPTGENCVWNTWFFKSEASQEEFHKTTRERHCAHWEADAVGKTSQVPKATRMENSWNLQKQKLKTGNREHLSQQS